jgi:hypothetical protein
MTDETRRQVEVALERAYRDAHPEAGPATEDRRTRDFVFHMTDWSDDLASLARLFREPAKHDGEAWRSAIDGVLLHAVGHLLAAARLDGGVSDPFAEANVGPARPALPVRRPSVQRR